MSETIKMNANKAMEAEPKTVNADDLSKEQCLEIIKQQSKLIEDTKQTMQRMYDDLKAQNMQNIFARLEFLFRVVSFADDFDSKFVNGCKEEIVELMTIQKPQADEGRSE